MEPLRFAVGNIEELLMRAYEGWLNMPSMREQRRQDLIEVKPNPQFKGGLDSIDLYEQRRYKPDHITTPDRVWYRSQPDMMDDTGNVEIRPDTIMSRPGNPQGGYQPDADMYIPYPRTIEEMNHMQIQL